MTNPNRSLPALNPLKARSTIAAVVSFAALVGPLIGGGIGGVAADLVGHEEAIQSGAESAVHAINTLVGTGALIWFWFERRAPNMRLSFARRTT